MSEIERFPKIVGHYISNELFMGNKIICLDVYKKPSFIKRIIMKLIFDFSYVDL